MPLVIPPGYADVAYELRNSGDPDPWYVTHGIQLPDTPDVEALAILLLGGFTTVMDLMAENTQNTAVKLTVGQDGATAVRYTIPRTGPGGIGGSGAAKLPQNCAALIRKNSALGGRQHRGRMFLPNVLDEPEVSEVGVLSPAIITALSNAMNTWFATFTSGSVDDQYPMVILHNSTGVIDTPDPTLVSSLGVDTILSTQRRRLR
jgi:hypothetical protein